jgi:DNA polymerase-1
VWDHTTGVYPALLAAGTGVDRCHDLSRTEALLRGGQAGPAADPPSSGTSPASAGGAVQPALFDPGPRDAGRPHPEHPADPPPTPAGSGLGLPVGLPAGLLADRLVDQLDRVRRARRRIPGFGLLVAAESATALAAAEMGRTGVPWSTAVHDEILATLLGPRPVLGGRPPTMQALAEEIGHLLGAPRLNPDSQPDLLRALHRAGLPLRTTRAWELRKARHPVTAPLLRYKELARLHSAHGWAWQEQWVRDGRFRPEYVPGGVVSGRWATRGGGALQIPRAVRAAVVADPGWELVMADAGQLEPRVLAALSGDERMAAATREGDLYAAIAAQAMGRPEARQEAKIALLAAMYGGGHSSPALAALRRRFPAALALLEDAARTGEDGGTVTSVLGRRCPPPHPGWQLGPEPVVGARTRARGRFTRNYVVQASAADWANVLVALLRRHLSGLAPGRRQDGPELVFFQHDEVIVHTPRELVPAVVDAVGRAGAEATRLVLGDRGVGVPLAAVVARSYAAKGQDPADVDPHPGTA